MDIERIERQLNKIFDELGKLKIKTTEHFSKDHKKHEEIINKHIQLLPDIVRPILSLYIILYVYLAIGHDYKWGHYKSELFSVSQSTKLLQSDYIAKILELNDLLKKIIIILGTNEQKLSQDYEKAYELLNKIGKDNLNKHINSSHDIVKLVIFNEYSISHKNQVMKLLTEYEQTNSEYVYIDIVVQNDINITYEEIESVLSSSQRRLGVAKIFYDMISDYNLYNDNTDNKIYQLINSGILVPIVDDFLLYHKDSEHYDAQLASLADKKKKEDTRLQYILKKIDDMANYYSDKVQSDPVYQQKIKRSLYIPLEHRKTILMNEYEDLKIIKKIQDLGKRAIENSENYNEFLVYRRYPYINFKDLINDGFNFKLNKTLDLVRYVTFEYPNKEVIQMRTGADDTYVNIVGFVFPSKKNIFQCQKQKHLHNIRSDKHPNAYKQFSKYVSNHILDNKRSKYWIFNLSHDILKLDSFEDVGKMDNFDKLKQMLIHFHHNISVSIINHIIKIINSYDHISFYRANHIIDTIQKYTFPIDKSLPEYNQLENLIYFNKREPIPEIESDLIIQFTSNTTYNKNDVIPLCHHYYLLEVLNKLKRVGKHEKFLTKFFTNYVFEDEHSNYICKSCKRQLNFIKYMNDGQFNNITGKYSPFESTMTIPLNEIKEYSKYNDIITGLNKSVEKIATIINIPHLTGSYNPFRMYRSYVIKNIIDFIIKNNQYLKHAERNLSQFGIEQKFTNITYFELENKIFSSDYNNGIVLNNILAYTIVALILEINSGHIVTIYSDKMCNVGLFEKFGQTLFTNLKLVCNNKGDIMPIFQLKTLCFIIYLFACLMNKYNIWYTDLDRKKYFMVIFKSIIHSVVDLLNILTLKNKAFYDKFAPKIHTFFKQTNLSQKKIPKQGYIQDLLPPQKPALRYTLSKYIPKRSTFVQSKVYYTNYTNCISGEFHKWNKSFICDLCNVHINKTTTENVNFVNYSKKFITNNLKENLSYEVYIASRQRQISPPTKYDEQKSKSNKSDETIDIHTLTDIIKNIYGNIITINNSKFSIDETIYSISYDYLGNKLNEPIIITDSNKNITIKTNHSLFKMDVIVYTEQTKNPLQIFYSLQSHILLGYKQVQQDLVINVQPDKKIQIIPSLLFQLNSIKNNPEFTKKTLLYISTLLYKIKSKQPIEDYGEQLPPFGHFIFVEYHNKLDNMKLSHFKNWYNKNHFVFLISELVKLINDNPNIKTNIIFFIIESINYIFNVLSNTAINTNLELKRFEYILNASPNVTESGYHPQEEQTTGIYGEYVDPDDTISPEEEEKIIDETEEQDALGISLTVDSDLIDAESENDMTEKIEFENEYNYRYA